jgi:hypothetical protein
MLKLVINGQQADLEGIKFTLQLNSPVPFDPGASDIDGSFAFGARFPASERNKLIFGNPHRLEKYPDPVIDFPGNLYFEGRMLFDVVVSLSEVSDSFYKANIKIGIGYYKNLIGEKSLRELAYEGVIDLGESTADVISHAMAAVDKIYPEAIYNFPVIRNEKFYGENDELNPDWQQLVNYYIHGSGFQENPVNDNEVSNYYNLCPFPYLFYVLTHCFTEFGYNVAGPVLRDTKLAKLLIYNNYALDLIEDRYKSVAETIQRQTINSETKIRFEHELINIDWCYDDQAFEYRVKVTGNHQISAHLNLEGIIVNPAYSVQAYVYVYLENDIIHTDSIEIMDPLTVECDINFIQDMATIDLDKHICIKVEFKDNFNQANCPGYVNIESWFSVQNIPWSLVNTYAKTIDIRNHVPDIKISAFLVTLFRAFGIVYSFNQKTRTVELLFIKDILSSVDEDVYTELTVKSSKLARFREIRSYKLNFAWSSADDYTKENFKTYDTGKLLGYYDKLEDLPTLAIEGQFAIIRNLNAVYQWVTDAWVYFTDRYQPFLVGDGKTAVSIDMSPLMMWAGVMYGEHLEVYPKILQEGSSAQLGLNEFGLHLLFYYGLIADIHGFSYPFASSTRYGPSGEILGDYEMAIDGDNGLYEIFLEEYYDFVKDRGRPVEYDRKFSASEIQDIDFLIKKRAFQHVYFLEQVNIPLTNTSIDTAEMKLLKI